jgi:tetratricopeptide (TPR) repeat protein
MNLRPLAIYIAAVVLSLLLVTNPAAAQKTGKGKKDKKKKDKTEVAAPVKNDTENQARIERILLDAEKAKVIEDWETALAKYSEILTVDPNNANAHYQLAQVYIQQSKYGAAIEEAAKAVKASPDNKWYHETLAQLYLSTGNFKEAINVFKQLVAKFPNNPDYYLNLAYLYARAGQLDEAIKVYDTFEKSFGLDESVILEKEKIYLKQNKFDAAMKELQKLVDEYPGDIDYLLMQGELYRASKMNDKAIEVYNKILQLEPDNPQALLSLADMGARSGDNASKSENLKKLFANPKMSIDDKVKLLYGYIQMWEVNQAQHAEAKELADILAATHPEEAKAHAIRGDLYYLDNNLDTALSAYVKSLSIQKDVFQVWQQVMLLYGQKQNWVELKKVTTEAMELFPNQVLVYLFKGNAESQLKEYDKAVKSYSKGEKMAGDNKELRSQFFSGLGDTYHNMGKNMESDSCYDRALKLQPDNAYVLNNYSYYLSMRKENLERAKEMSAYANKLEPGNSSFLDTYAWIFFQLGQYNDAKQWQEKAMQAGGDKSGTILEHYGDILFKLGDKAKAFEYWKQAKTLGTDSGTIDRKIAEQNYFE